MYNPVFYRDQCYIQYFPTSDGSTTPRAGSKPSRSFILQHILVHLHTLMTGGNWEGVPRRVERGNWEEVPRRVKGGELGGSSETDRGWELGESSETSRGWQLGGSSETGRGGELGVPKRVEGGN